MVKRRRIVAGWRIVAAKLHGRVFGKHGVYQVLAEITR